MIMIEPTTGPTQTFENQGGDLTPPESQRNAAMLPGRDAATATRNKGKLQSLGGILKGIMKRMTLANMFILYALSGILPFGGKTDGRDISHGSTTTQPTFQQHFLWEPLGYVPSIAVPVPEPQNPVPQRGRRYSGYYTKDKMAMKTALLSIPSRNQVADTQQQTKVCQTIKRTNDTTSDIDIALAEEFEDEACAAGTTTPKTSNRSRIGSALSSSVVMLDLQLGVDPTKEVAFVRSVVTFLIGVTRESKGSLEVLVRMESSGGSVQAYGLLAEQLRRLREEPNVTLTVTCDLVALSGGYLAASLASPGQLLASPFASVGSIGVVHSTGLGFREAMETLGIQEFRVKSGERKATGGGLGGMSNDELIIEQERTDAIHQVFRDHVLRWRGNAIQNIDFVTSGDHWLGVHALKFGLVDRLITSDEYLDDKIKEGYNVVLVKDYSKQKAGFLGGEYDQKSWLWIVFDWVFPPDGLDNQARVAAAEELEPSFVQAIRMFRGMFHNT